MKKINQLIKSVMMLVLIFPALIFSQQSQQNPNGLFKSGLLLSAAENKAPRKTRKTPAMRERIYSQLSRAQKLADENKVEEGLAVLDRVKSRIDQINSYEKAMLWNFYGFIYYGKDDAKSAIRSFEKVVEQKNIPESLELSTLFSLAQLSMASGQFNKTINFIEKWSVVKGGELSDSALVLKANAYYSMKEYKKAEESITEAVKHVFNQEKIPKENWLVLKRALHYETKKVKQVTHVSEQLVRYYSKPKYWIELANMYGETDQTEKQLAVMEAALQQGYVSKKTDIQSLAQLYYFSGAPYKAARLLSSSITKGAIDGDVKVLKFIAQAWFTAKETDKAVPILKQAAQLSKDGNVDAKLAEAFVELERWEEVIMAAKEAKRKGMLDNPGNIYIALGMAQFNLKDFSSAMKSFQLAKNEKQQSKVADQWLRYVKKEKYKHEKLQLAAVGS